MSDRRRRTLVGLIALLVLGLVTGPKLLKMCRIRGFLSGAIVSSTVVTDKWHQDKSEGSRNTYWVCWKDSNIREVGNHRLNFPEDVWNSITVGDSIELIYLYDWTNSFRPEDSHARSSGPFHSEGHFASNGNFVVDILFFIILSVLVWKGAKSLFTKEVE